jgi:hypothetical protein
MGSQWLSCPYQQQVREIVRSGKLGKIVSISQSWNFNGPRWHVPKSENVAAIREIYAKIPTHFRAFPRFRKNKYSILTAPPSAADMAITPSSGAHTGRFILRAARAARSGGLSPRPAARGNRT